MLKNYTREEKSWMLYDWANSAFSAIVADGNTISASSLGVAGFFAASVKGFATGTYTIEVMPYVILMDGTAIVGAPYSFETWF